MPLRNDQEKLNQLNKQLLEAVQLSGNAFLSSTTVNGAFCLRACVITDSCAKNLTFSTHRSGKGWE
jgi:hypothetical protein